MSSPISKKPIENSLVKVGHGRSVETPYGESRSSISDYRSLEFNFTKGWHVVRNRTFKEREGSAISRDTIEKDFFRDSRCNWHVVDPRHCGIESLRHRLSDLLYKHTKSQLPKVRIDIANKLEGYTRSLRGLQARLHKPEKLWNDFQQELRRLASLAGTGIEGKFNNHFYNEYNEEVARFLRSRIEESNDAFVDEMTMHGHGFAAASAENDPSHASDSFVEEVKNMLKRTRGEELPDRVDPQRLNMLWWKHSKRWHGIAQAHVRRACGHCLDFVAQMINVYLRARLPGLQEEVCSKMVEHLRVSLETQRERAWKELKCLEDDRNRAPKTRNKTFITKSERKRAQRAYVSTMRALNIEDNRRARDDDTPVRVTPDYWQHLSGHKTGDTTAEFLAMDMLLYYEIARDVFVDNVLIQVIERHLLAPLSSLFHGDYGIDQATFFSACNNEDRRELETQQKVFEEKIAMLTACHAELT